MSKLEIKKGHRVKRPIREPDYYSKRNVAYWWTPEWVRGTSSSNEKFSRIIPKKIKSRRKDGDDSVELYMLSKDGNATFIRGSIQYEFVRWHEDNQIDYILLGMDIDDVLHTNWEYEKI